MFNSIRFEKNDGIGDQNFVFFAQYVFSFLVVAVSFNPGLAVYLLAFVFQTVAYVFVWYANDTNPRYFVSLFKSLVIWLWANCL